MKNKNNKTSKQDEVAGLIQFLGDITKKAAGKHETEAAKSGINSLTEIALKFIELRNKKKNVREGVTAPSPFRLRNEIIDNILDAFEKIFVESIPSPDSVIPKELILHLSAILKKALPGGDNWNIIEKIIETRNVYGVTYSKLMRYCLENEANVESNIITQHLAAIPQLTILEGKFDLQYVLPFIEYHIYRITKMIIEYDNFQTFTNELEYFFNSLQFRDPEEIAGRITGNISMLGLVDVSETGKQKTEELVFNIEFAFFKDFNTYFKILKMVEEYGQYLQEKVQSNKEQLNIVLQRIDHIKEQLKELYISLLIHAVFFRIGAFIIFKGSSYPRYIDDLWYHGKSKFGYVNIINSTPVSESIKWNTLFTIYSGYGSSIDYDFYLFEDFPDWESYHYQYCALMMIKTGKWFSFDFNKLERLQSDKKQDEFLFYYELASLMKVEKFVDAVNKIENNEKLLSIIRISNVKQNIASVKDGLTQLKKDQSKVLDLLVKHGKLNPNKIEEVKKQISGHYFAGSIVDKVSLPKYNPNLINPNLISKENVASVPRDHFIDQSFSARFLIDPVISPLAHEEMMEILKVLQSKIIPISQDTMDFEEQIKSNIRLLRNEGKNPNVIFIPLDVEMSLIGTNLFSFGAGRKLKVDDTELYVINSWKGLDFTDIIIFDSNYLSITYKAENKQNRIIIQESNTDKGKDRVLFTCKIIFLIEIVDTRAFRRIINQNIIALKNKNEM